MLNVSFTLEDLKQINQKVEEVNRRAIGEASQPKTRIGKSQVFLQVAALFYDIAIFLLVIVRLHVARSSNLVV